MTTIDRYLGLLRGSLDRLGENACTLEEVAEAVALAGQTVCLGVGKSGFIARKLSASLMSISVRSAFLHPCEAAHGDIGLVEPGAVVVAFSKSGNSSEINAILGPLRERRTRIVAITCRGDSPLGRAAEWVLHVPVAEEGDAHNILPLISTDLSLVLANLLVAEVSQRRNVQPADFARNHPGGQLGFAVGRRLVDLEDWKQRHPVVPPGTSLMDAILMDSKHKAGLVCVADAEGRLLGILSDGDIRRAVVRGLDLAGCIIDDLLNREPVLALEGDTVGEALQRMEGGDRKVFSAPVVDSEKRCVGVLTLHDLIRRG